MPQPGQKNLRNVSEMYREVKRPVSLGLTQFAVSQLDQLARAVGISRSELVERLARGFVEIERLDKLNEPDSTSQCLKSEDVITVYHTHLSHLNDRQIIKVLIHQELSVTQ